MKKQPTDKAAWQAAHDITDITKRGEDVVKDAILKATAAMPKLITNTSSKEGKIEMLKAHAFELGMAARLRREVLPLANEMVDDLSRITGDKNHAELMAEIWLAKVIREVRNSEQ